LGSNPNAPVTKILGGNMKVMKEVITPASNRLVCDKVLCDICRCEMAEDQYEDSQIKSPEHKKSGFLKTDVYHNRAKAFITYEEGYSYPDCGQLTKQEWDICPDCFYLKVVPFLKSLGAEPSSEKSNW